MRLVRVIGALLVLLIIFVRQGRTDFSIFEACHIEKTLEFGQALGALNCLYDGAKRTNVLLSV